MVEQSFIEGTLDLKHHTPDAVRIVESSYKWTPKPPRLVLDLSGATELQWKRPSANLISHETRLVQRDDVMLFGQNHLIDTAGRWNCESIAFPHQYIEFYRAPFYDLFYPGQKPTIVDGQNGEGYSLIIDHSLSKSAILLPDPVFLVTPLEPDNWGRWLCTVLAKLHLVRSTQIDKSLKILCRRQKSWQNKIIEFMGFSCDSILDHDPGRTYICNSVTTSIYSAADFAPTAAERDLFSHIVERCAAQDDQIGERIFVSRAEQSKRSPHYRVLSNEAELSARLADIGFTSIEPEQFTFEEQVHIFSRAKVVVGLGGSGMFNTIFCHPGTTVIDLESSTDFVSDHARLFAAMDLDYAVIFGKQDENDPNPVHKRWEVDVSSACEAIKKLL